MKKLGKIEFFLVKGNDRIKKERIMKHLGISSTGDKLRETHLRWFGHVQHRRAIMSVRKSLSMQVDAHQGKGVGRKGHG